MKRIFAVSVPSKCFLLAAKCARCRDTENESQDLVPGDKSQIAVDFDCLVADLKHHEKPSIQALPLFSLYCGGLSLSLSLSAEFRCLSLEPLPSLRRFSSPDTDNSYSCVYIFDSVCNLLLGCCW
ncbi:hypothetical protein RHGRI_007746 [Rhododendron griersonianum]|uniref:Uncharacterized protein n=1 Tax=Rhododendron griersonianum TaxID=479676 RepID=A0AAV6KYN9_9ERIC|nr:hypothetical protein RHGRI_007746 [Rhododendron griersonianum]